MGTTSSPPLCIAVLFSVFAFFFLWISPSGVQCKTKYEWMKRDHFDIIDDQVRSVNAQNCRSKNLKDLIMRSDTVAQLPYYNELRSRIWYRNRTSLIHIHNMALNRAFFYSYVLQRMNDSASFTKQPNWMYYYFSAVADVNANPSILNGSAFYFDNDCHYPNWYTTVPFNKTLPLFGAKAYRWDDFRDQDNYLREPTRQVVQVVDAGAGRNANYTHKGYKMNPWYANWLPDIEGNMDSLTKFAYYVGIKRSNVTGKFLTEDFEAYAFYGPTSPSASETDKRKLPVVFTAPYFDCGGSNKWVISALSPVVDFMPRYSNYTHLRRQRFVGVVVMDTDFIKLDFNACGVSPGNPGPSYLSGIARCRRTTGCKHKMGYGFKRGGYVCVCASGWSYPWHLDPPYQGDSVEQATEEEYYNDFQCTHSDFRLVLPVVDSLSGVSIEGGGVVVSSGGVDATRTKRDAGNSSLPQGYDTDFTDINPKLRYSSSWNRPLDSSINSSLDAQSPPTKHLDKNRNKSIDTDSKEHFGIDSTNTKRKNITEDDTNKNIDNFNKGNVKYNYSNNNDGAFGSSNNNSSTSKSKDEPSLQRVIELADKLREIREEADRTGVYKFIKDDMTLTFIPTVDDYAERNNVDVDIESLYKEDVRAHKQYKAELVEEQKKHKNFTRTTMALRESIVKLRNRHVNRFIKNRDGSTPQAKTVRTETLHSRRRKRAAVYDPKAFDRMMRVFRHKASVTPSNCHTQPAHRLWLSGDVAYGVNAQFRPEGQTAVRLAHFLSMYFQNVMPDENFGNLRGGGPIHPDHLYGEVMANVMGNFRIYAAGVYFDKYKFQDADGNAREYFGPWAFERKGSYYVMDTAGLSYRYTDEEFFKKAKARFRTNFKGLQTFKIRAYNRNDPQGHDNVRHEYFPMTYKAAPYEVGYWSRPHFRCDGHVDAWVITYVSPFFGLDSLRRKLEFRGVTTVDIPLNLLEINQCPQSYSVPNAFKNTARCDYLSTTCVAQPGFPFLRGSYRCLCRLGFEYWHLDGKFWIEGSLMELEYEKKRLGKFSRFDHLNCRVSSSSHMHPSIHLTVWAIVGAIIWSVRGRLQRLLDT